MLGEFKKSSIFPSYFSWADVIKFVFIFIELVFLFSDFHDFWVEQFHAGIVLDDLLSGSIFLVRMSAMEFVSPPNEMRIWDFGIFFVETHHVFAIWSSMISYKLSHIFYSIKEHLFIGVPLSLHH